MSGHGKFDDGVGFHMYEPDKTQEDYGQPLVTLYTKELCLDFEVADCDCSPEPHLEFTVASESDAGGVSVVLQAKLEPEQIAALRKFLNTHFGR